MTGEGGQGGTMTSGEAAWRAMCDRIRDAGSKTLGRLGALSAADRAEGVRYFARVMAKALEWEVDYADPEFPQFYRFDDSNTVLVGPNPDNDYLLARLKGEADYVIRGDASGILDFHISLHDGFVFTGNTLKWGDVGRKDLDIGTDGKFELVLSARRHEGNWVELKPETDFVWIRLYYGDWATSRPVPFTIERIGSDREYPRPLDEATISKRLDRAASFFEGHVDWGMNWAISSATPPNQPSELHPLGLYNSNLAYGWCSFDVEPGMALIVEYPKPDARHWMIACYTHPWMTLDTLAHRMTSLNACDVHIDADDQVRIVVAGSDPSVRNWLDISEHRRGMLFYNRAWYASLEPLTAQLVKLDEVTRHLPAETPVLTPAERADQIRVRRELMALRGRL